MIYNYSTIPNELKQEKRFCLWVNKNGSKLPIDANTGKYAKSNDPATWSTYEVAIKNVDKYNASGLGFMLGNGFFGIDLDNHNGDDNSQLYQEFITTLKSYSEYSQSGKGIHIICRGYLPKGSRRKGDIEMYDNARFFALTGNRIDGTEDYGVENRTSEIKALYDKYLGSKVDNNINVDDIVINSNTDHNRLLTNNEIINKIIASKKGALFNLLYYNGNEDGLYHSQSEADIALCNILAFWCNKNARQMDEIFRSSRLMREKWDEKRGEKTYGEITIERAIRDCKETYSNLYIEPDGKVITLNGEVVDTFKVYSLDDTGNAERFYDTYKNEIHYNVDNKNWMIWNGKTWQIDEKEEIKKKVDQMIEQMKKEVIYEKDDKKAYEMLKNCRKLASNQGKNAMLKEAQHIGSIPIKNVDFDINPYLLNTYSGVIDLRSGKVSPHKKELLLSKITKYEISFDEPKLWLKALNEIFCDDTELIDFIHRALGYSITGLTREQCLFQLTGVGGNGKSVFLNLIYEILGSYTLNMQIDSILAKNNSLSSSASSDIARLNGVRLVRTNEPNEGARFNEGLVKQMTGGDVITARFLYGKEFDFKPIFKLWIACNSKIIVRGTDRGIWRRMRVIDFKRIFDDETADKDLESKLLIESPKILGWLIKGAIKYLNEGLTMPLAVRQATEEYKTEMDVLSQFLNENIELSTVDKVGATKLYSCYHAWAKLGNEYIMSQTKFGREVGKRYKKENINGSIFYIGIRLKQDDEFTIRLK